MRALSSNSGCLTVSRVILANGLAAPCSLDLITSRATVSLGPMAVTFIAPGAPPGAYRPPMKVFSLGGLGLVGEADRIAEAVELVHGVPLDCGAITFVGVVQTEVLVLAAPGEEVVDDG